MEIKPHNKAPKFTPFAALIPRDVARTRRPLAWRYVSMTKLLFLFAILFSQTALACVAPRGGEKYDKLLKIEESGDGLFSFSVPRNILGHDSNAQISLDFYKMHEKGYWFNESSEPVQSEVDKESVVGRFKINPRQGYRILLTAYWPPISAGLCATFARSKILYDGSKT